MSQEFKKCLERSKIKTFSPGTRLAKKELKLAGEDLKISLKSLAEENYRWSIIQISMANAVAGDTVYFRGGTYTLPKINLPSCNSRWRTGLIAPSYSGTTGNPANKKNFK